ncbi:MAG: hypothetical protein JST32_06670 [Bacteroidetes bacterium]|nr:hypothetical protein [Bacteroidota bacterium]
MVELKKSIHEKIDELDDQEFLEIVETMVRNKGKIFQIPEDHIAGIRQGEEDIKNGDFFTMEELEKRYERWLKD